MEKVAIFVPGFLGSTLHLGGVEWGELNKVWLGLPTFLGGGYRYLDLDGQFPIPGGLPLQVGSALGPIYSDFIDWLRPRFDSIYVVAWDWRFSLAAAVPAVAASLTRELAAGNKVTIIGHSAGGKAAALAAASIPPADRANLSWVVTVGAPWRGSWRAPESLLGRSESVHQGAALAAAGQFSIARIERYRIQKVLSSLPGLYELFPTTALQEQLSPAGAPSVWNPAAWAGLFQPLNAGKLAAGHMFADGHDQPDISLPLVNVYGVGESTPGPFLPGDDLADATLNYALDGDGVVSVQSAIPVVRARAILLQVPGDHGRLCSSQGTLSALGALL